MVYLTASTDIKTMQRAKVSGTFGYIIKPFDINTLYINIEMALYKHQLESKVKKTEEELQLTLAKLRKALGGTINAIALTVESKDPYTAGHQRRVAGQASRVKNGHQRVQVM